MDCNRKILYEKYYMERYKGLRRDVFFENMFAASYFSFLFQSLNHASDSFTNVT